MSNEIQTNDQTNEPTVKIVKDLDARINDATEDLAKAQARLDKLVTERDNRAKLETIAAGASVTFDYGRGEKRRTLTGVVVAVGDDDKGTRMLAVAVGEGINVETYKIRAVDVIFDTEVTDA